MKHSQTDPIGSVLSAGISQLGLTGSPGLLARLRGYLRELERWNRSYNLTSVRDVGSMVGRHILDSLSIAPWVEGMRVLDLGSGAGLPGIPLALADPGRQFDLLDANGKKARFLRHVVRTLEIENATVIEARVEAYHPPAGYDTVLARAFAGLDKLAPAAAHVTRPGGRLLAMRGRVEGLAPDFPLWRHRGTHALEIPGLEADRHVSIFIRTSDKG